MIIYWIITVLQPLSYSNQTLIKLTFSDPLSPFHTSHSTSVPCHQNPPSHRTLHPYLPHVHSREVLGDGPNTSIETDGVGLYMRYTGMKPEGSWAWAEKMSRGGADTASLRGVTLWNKSQERDIRLKRSTATPLYRLIVCLSFK